MEAESFFPVLGEEKAAHTLRVRKAREVAAYLLADLEPYARLIECRTEGTSEVLVLEVEPERPQRPVHDIRRSERLAIYFDPNDILPPDVLALRKSFPQVPHLNIRLSETPKSLCLFEDRYEDYRLRWSPTIFLKQLLLWLSRTARGELHDPDQLLEPLLVGSSIPLVIPYNLFDNDAENTTPLSVYGVEDGRGRLTLRALREQRVGNNPLGPSFVMATVTAQPQEHGLIQVAPGSLTELHEYLMRGGADLLSVLRAQFLSWKEENTKLLEARLIILTYLPKTRGLGGGVETRDIWAFLSVDSVRKIGIALDIWQEQDGELGILFPSETNRRGQDTELAILNPMKTLSRELAADLSGSAQRVAHRIVAVGQGALGSQVTKNLTRSAYGEWIVIDDDHYLPHNGSRHDLPGEVVGVSKAAAVAHFANVTIDGPPIVRPIVANVLQLGDKHDEVNTAYREADIILDMAASVAVSRHLIYDVDSSARRVSLFLNPLGSDLVLLAEDRNREIQLDHLEMQYYQLLLAHESLHDHLVRQDSQIRYGLSCRDLAFQLPQDLVALHAALGSRALKKVLTDDDAAIIVWRVDDELSVKNVAIEPPNTYSRAFGEWRLVWNENFLSKVFRLRSDHLPDETGGTLVGAYDLQRKIVYAVDVLPSPPDSKEYPTVYIRGAEGLKCDYDIIRTRTAGMLEYIGEWHTHPNGSSCTPSSDDQVVFTWLTQLMRQDSLPPLMLIAGGEQQCSWYLGADSIA